MRTIVASRMTTFALLGFGHVGRLLVSGVMIPSPALFAVEIEAAEHGIERLKINRAVGIDRRAEDRHADLHGLDHRAALGVEDVEVARRGPEIDPAAGHAGRGGVEAHRRCSIRCRLPDDAARARVNGISRTHLIDDVGSPLHDGRRCHDRVVEPHLGHQAQRQLQGLLRRVPGMGRIAHELRPIGSGRRWAR